MHKVLSVLFLLPALTIAAQASEKTACPSTSLGVLSCTPSERTPSDQIPNGMKRIEICYKLNTGYYFGITADFNGQPMSIALPGKKLKADTYFLPSLGGDGGANWTLTYDAQSSASENAELKIEPTHGSRSEPFLLDLSCKKTK